MTVILHYLGVLLYAVLFSRHLPKRQNHPARAAVSLLVLLLAVGILSYMETIGKSGLLLDLSWLGACSFALFLSYSTSRPILYFFWALVPLGIFGWAKSLDHLIFTVLEPSDFMRHAVGFITYCVVGFLSFMLFVWNPQKGSIKKHVNRGLFLVVVSLLMSLFGMVDSYTQGIMPPWQNALFRSILSLLALLMLYIFEIEYNLRDDYEMLSELLEKDRIRYAVSKEYTDLINMKFHDIKHQIGKLRKAEKVDPEYLDQLEASIRQYDSELHTGNEALDIILTEKNRLCTEKNIEATIIADGKALSFMSASDIYSVFGNILDNAIEASEKLPDDDMKQISLVAAEESGVIRIRIQNFFAEMPKPSGDSYQTTKKDTDAHGFGIRSIKYIVEKYGGVVSTEIHGNRFTMNILLPQSV